jgi:phospholipid transport system substrate-binding protein
MKMIKTLIVIIALFFSVQIFAASESPAVMLNNVAQSAIAALKKEKASLPPGKKIPLSSIYRIVNQKFLPYADLDAMSRAAIGRAAWGSANGKQRKEFIEQFTDLVINTYASALTSFNNNKVQFYQIRGGYEGKSIVQVNSTITAPDTKPLPVVYHLEKKNGKWLIYDFSVDGISLVESYKAQFSPIVQEKGMNGLIAMLKQSNKQLSAANSGH